MRTPTSYSGKGWLASRLLDELPEEPQGISSARARDVVTWAEHNFYIPETRRPVVLEPHQRAILRAALTPVDRPAFPYTNVIYSTVKKSGKTAIGGAVTLWMAETQTTRGQLYCTGSDAEQAKNRAFAAARTAVELTPGFLHGAQSELPNRWTLQDRQLRSIKTGSYIKAIAVDYRGEAGANPALTMWTELWTFEYKDALRFWEEMTPVPTLPVSIRFIETYAGFEGESDLLYSLYKTGLAGRQLTAGELVELSGEALGVFEEAPNPDSLVPIWVNEAASLFMYWDSGTAARRMPWQKGKTGEKYYAEQAAILPEPAFTRYHYNEWVGAESEFVPMVLWDACHDPELPPFEPGDRTPTVVGVDAAATGDSFAVVAVTRHPKRHDDPAIRACRKWDPPPGGRIDFTEPEAWMRELCKLYNVVQVAYDPYQLEDMMQRLRRDAVAWCEQFNQGGDRLVADRQFHDLIINRRLAHTSDLDMRSHVQNANAKLQKDEDSKLRLVKKAANRKIDLAVAASMACSRCLYLLL